MSNFLKTVLTILVVSLGFSFAFNTKTFAEEHLDLEKHNIQELENGIYYDKDKGLKFNKIYNVVGGVLTEKSLEEYVKDKEESKKVLEEDAKIDSLVKTNYITPTKYSIEPFALGTRFIYKESSNRKVLIYGGRASLPVSCPTTSCDQSIGYAYTQSASYSQSWSSAALSVIHAGAGFTWSLSESTSSSARMQIPVGYKGYWHFTPLMNRTDGTLYGYNELLLVSTTATREYSPVRINNQLDGELLAVIEKLPTGN